jgi:hypothetical protein
MRWLLAIATAAAVGCIDPPRAGGGAAREEAAVQKAPPAPKAGQPRGQVAREYLVTLAARADPKVIAAVYGRFGIERTQDLGRGVFLVRLAEDPGLARMEELRRGEPLIEAIQPNFAYQATDRPAGVSPPASRSLELAPSPDGGRQ